MSRYRIIGNQKERAVEWAKDKFPDQADTPYWGEAYTALIHELDNDIIACVIYNEFHTGVSCSFHVATAPGKRWITRPFLLEVFGYPFLELGMLRLNAKVAATNTRIIRLIEHLGFRREGFHPDAWAKGIPLVSYGLLRGDCRYLEPNFRCWRTSQSKTLLTPKPWVSPIAGVCSGLLGVTARAMDGSVPDHLTSG